MFVKIGHFYYYIYKKGEVSTNLITYIFLPWCQILSYICPVILIHRLIFKITLKFRNYYSSVKDKEAEVQWI